jgi:acyl-CoA synthetase (AMP-forming)/AMP-acid ligase II
MTTPGDRSGVTLTWRGADRLTPAQWEAILGPGAPFELVEEDVLGSKLPVFARRWRTVVEGLVEGGRRFPDLEYLVFPDRTLTFSSVLGPVASVAAALRDRYGVGPGDRVAIVAANCAAHVITSWAAISLGAIPAELNGWWTGPEIAYAVELTRPNVLLGDAKRLDRLDPSTVDVPIVEFEDGFAELEAHAPGVALPDVAMDEDDPMVILFTSGTTGRPKGATLTHRNHIHMLMQSRLGQAVAAALAGTPAPRPPARIEEQPTTVSVSPLFHVSGFSVQLIHAPFTGTRLVYPAPGRFSEETHLSMTERYRPTRWSVVPTHLWRLLEWPGLGDYDLSSLKSVGGGSSTWAPELLRQVKEKIPSVDRVTMGYGLTETTGGGTNHDGDTGIAHPGSVGRAGPGVEVQIRGPHGEALGEHEVGEIQMRSAMNFLGYWNNPEATAACLDADRWFRTGDYGHISDGLLYLESRRSDMIIRGGENVYPIEIENRLIEHPDIAECAVVGVDHRTLGQEVKAFVVVRPGASVSADDVRAWVGETLAAFKVPTVVEFADSLPHNATGKVMKHLLLQGSGPSGFTED